MNADILMADGGFAATMFPVISGYNLEDARVENLTVDGNRAENPTKVDGCRTAGIFLYRGDNCVISNCFVRDYNGDGISFQQSNDVKVEGCVVERCAGFGLHPGSGSQRPSVKNCRAIANGDDGFFFCWRVRGGVAEGNWLENNGGYGMSIGHKDSDNFVRKNTIIGNKLGGVYWRAETEPMAAHRDHVREQHGPRQRRLGLVRGWRNTRHNHPQQHRRGHRQRSAEDRHPHRQAGGRGDDGGQHRESRDHGSRRARKVAKPRLAHADEPGWPAGADQFSNI